jgi:CTP synthase (UTP-ammonia lyase)
MSQYLKIAVIGDYNFTYNSHHATNLAIEHSERYLECNINHYWITIQEASTLSEKQFNAYDGVIIAPGPYKNPFFLRGIIRVLTRCFVPVLTTDKSYEQLIECLVLQSEIDFSNDKVISNNLIEESSFQRIEIIPSSDRLKKMYATHTNIELSSSRYSVYPHVLEILEKEYINIEAMNQFNDPEIISLKRDQFFMATMFCPQVSSTREMPHPIFNEFFTKSLAHAEKV